MSFPESEPQQRAGHGFEATDWSVVLAVSAADPEVAQKALEKLCQDYWRPIYNFARGLGQSEPDAEDAVQGFMAHLLEKEVIKKACEDKGRFRTFLISSFRHHLTGQFEKSSTQKRGGDTLKVPLDGSTIDIATGAASEIPDRAYEKAFAEALFARCLELLEAEYRRMKKTELYLALVPQLTGTEDQGIQEVAAQLHMTPATARQALHRLRNRYREIVHTEVRRMVASEEDFYDELRYLRGILNG